MHKHKLPEIVEKELAPFVSEQPTSKEQIITRIKEFSWHKNDIKQVLNYLFGMPIRAFYKGRDGHIYFDNFSIE